MLLCITSSYDDDYYLCVFVLCSVSMHAIIRYYKYEDRHYHESNCHDFIELIALPLVMLCDYTEAVQIIMMIVIIDVTIKSIIYVYYD